MATATPKKKNKVLSRIKEFIERPKFRLGLGIALAISGLVELFEIATEKVLGFDIGIEHAILLIAFNQSVTALAHIIEGVETLDEVEIEKRMEQEIQHRTQQEK